MRGAKKDITVTKNLREAGFLTNGLSFVDLKGHLFLKGVDKSRVRPFVFKKHKKCAVCGAKAVEDAQGQLGDGYRSEWHHTKNCDCVGCAEVRCGQRMSNCHRHRTLGFQRKAEAVKAFGQLYPPESA